MQTYRSLVEYTRWANRLVFGLCRDCDPAIVAAETRGANDGIERTLKHIVRVEEAFLAMLRGQQVDDALEAPSAYFKHDLSWFARRADEVADGYDELLGRVDEAYLDGELKIPWFDHPVTRRDAFIQAMTHSLQHRSQICSVLGDRGVQIPDMDYVHMRQKQAGDR